MIAFSHCNCIYKKKIVVLSFPFSHFALLLFLFLSFPLSLSFYNLIFLFVLMLFCVSIMLFLCCLSFLKSFCLLSFYLSFFLLDNLSYHIPFSFYLSLCNVLFFHFSSIIFSHVVVILSFMTYIVGKNGIT